jgi:hypothetical protein
MIWLAARGILPAVEPTWEYAVQVGAAVQESPPQITLNWVQDNISAPGSYTISRKALNDTVWGPGVELPGTATSFTDTDVSIGAAYEYQVYKVTANYVGYGYIYAGIDAPLAEHRGTVLLIVDNTYASDLASDLSLLQQDLVGDGWTVVRQDVGRNDSVSSVRAFIQAQYNADPANVNTVFLFGHVPVPYSGDIGPDEDAGHIGAWSADVYYGNMTGTWTDDSVDDTSATSLRNQNVPGDGKFDQSAIPGPVELMVGRVDLANMPGQMTWNGPATFPSEVDLLRQYLAKDHAFRQGWMNLPRRGLIADFFGNAGGEAYSASGWRNFAPFFGPQNIEFLPNQGTWLNTLSGNAFLCAYGCGPGQFSGISGLGTSTAYYVATTTDLVEADPQAAFFMVFGSWLGDWDSQDDFMRAVLATPTYGLACCWSGAPHWFCQHFVLGEPLGFSARLTQNNGPEGLYQTQVMTYAGLVHIALMGDPTLRMHPVGPPSNLTATTNSGVVQLSWTASSDNILGYHIYRATDPGGPYTRLSGSLLTGTTFTDSSAASATYTYMVRAVKLEATPSGTYFNPSQGAFTTLTTQTTTSRIGIHVNSVAVSPGGIVLTWTSSPGANYRVESVDDLASTNWTDFNTNITADGELLSWTDAATPAAQQRFYRVFQVP